MCTGEESEECEGGGWSSKPYADWSRDETTEWIMEAARWLGIPYSMIQQGLVLPGKELSSLSRHDFAGLDPVNGERFYSLLHSHASGKSSEPSVDYFAPRHHQQRDFAPEHRGPYHPSNDDEHQPLGSSNVSGQLNSQTELLFFSSVRYDCYALYRSLGKIIRTNGCLKFTR